MLRFEAPSLAMEYTRTKKIKLKTPPRLQTFSRVFYKRRYRLLIGRALSLHSHLRWKFSNGIPHENYSIIPPKAFCYRFFYNAVITRFQFLIYFDPVVLWALF